MSDIDRGVVTFTDIDIVLVHDREDNTVSVDVYDKENKRLGKSEMRLIK